MGEATSFPPPPGLAATFTELVSAGRLDLFESQSMRRSLVAYDEYTSLYRDQISIFERPITESKPVIFRAITLEAIGVAKTEFDDLEALLDVDREMLRNDPEILTALQVVYATQDNVHVVLISIRGTILDILDQIKAERERGASMNLHFVELGEQIKPSHLSNWTAYATVRERFKLVPNRTLTKTDAMTAFGE